MRRAFGQGPGLLLVITLAVCTAAFRGSQSTQAESRRSSSAIAITADGSTLLVVNPDSSSLTLVDTVAHGVEAEIPVGVDPRTVAVDDAARRVYVANRASGNISVIDLAGRVVIATIDAGVRPYGIVVSPDGSRLYVADQGAARVMVFATANLTLVHTIQVGDRPSGLALAEGGRSLLVTHLLTGKLSVVSLPSGTSTVLPLWGNSNLAQSVVPAPNGRKAYVPHIRSNTGNPTLTFDTTVFPVVSVIDVAARKHLVRENIALDTVDPPGVGLPFDAAVSPDGETLWVVNAASNDITVVDLGTRTRLAHIDVGENPRGIVLVPDGSEAYVNNTLDGTVSVIDALSYTVTDTIQVTRIPLPPALLRGKRLFHTSDDPRMARVQWIACNSCHFEGEHDGRTWIFGFSGPRNTTDLHGMVATYPLRWSAEWDESADSEQAVRKEQFGTGLVDGAMNPTLGDPNQGRSFDLDCLASYIDSLQPLHLRGAPGLDVERVERGRELFFSATTGCSSCHPPPYYLDHRRHDVGTATGDGERLGPEMDTPSLRGLWRSAPYLHDGSAATITEVLTTRNTTDLHGVTSGLTAGERADLEAFLLSIPPDAGVIVPVRSPPERRSPGRPLRVLPVEGTVTPPPASTLEGRVVKAAGGEPVPGAVVSIRASGRWATTGTDGGFVIATPEEVAEVELTAWAPGFYIASLSTMVPASGLELSLRALHMRDDASYTWQDPRPEVGGGGACGNCHPQIVQRWQGNAHARAISNPRFYSFYNGTDVAGSRTVLPGYVLDFPGTAGSCATCHAPASAMDAPFSTGMNGQRDRLTAGIHCDFCHKTESAYLRPGTRSPYSNMPGTFSLRVLRPPSGDNVFFGPYPDIHDPDTYAPQMRESGFCAPCHQHSFWGTPIYTSYPEWLSSSYPGRGITCQTCHMPPSGDTHFVLPEQGGLEHPPEAIPSHLQLGITDVAFMQTAAELKVNVKGSSGEVGVTVTVSNVGAGHHLPTGHPGRHLLLVVEARDANGAPLPLLSGPVVPVWGGSYAGRPGKGFAKLLRDAITGESPVVSYWKQTLIASDTRLPAEGQDESEFVFGAGSGGGVVSVKLVFRRLFEPIAVRYGWPMGEIVVKEVSREVQPGQ